MGWLGLRPDPPRWASYGDPSSLTALTASAQRLRSTGKGMQRLSQEWQARSLAYYDLSAIARFAADEHGKALAKVRIFPAFLEDGEIVEIEEGEEGDDAIEWLNRIHDDGSTSRTGMQASFARQMFMTGDGYLLGTASEMSRDEEKWEFVSVQELRKDGRQFRRYAGGPGSPENLEIIDDDDFAPLTGRNAAAYRMYRPHPAYSLRADSPMHPLLDLFEEMILLQMAVHARVKSRLASAGILFYSDEISFPSLDGQKDVPGQDRLMRIIFPHMTRPIQEPGSASAVMPLTMRVPTGGKPLQDLFWHWKPGDPNEVYREQGLRSELLEHIAIGVDLPAEVVKGLADANHWTGWQIDEQYAKRHIYPVAQLWCDNLLSVYLRPTAKAEKFERWDELVIGYDAADIVVHPDQTENAKDLYDRKALKRVRLAESLGFTEADLPDDTEVGWILSVEAGQAPGQEQQPVEGQQAPEQAAQDTAMETGAQVIELPPLNAQAASIMGIAEAHLDRARDVAGARLRSRLNGEAKETVDGVPNSLVAASVGATACDVPAQALVHGTAAAFGRTLERKGMSDEWREMLGEHLESHAARTIFDRDASLPHSFRGLVDRAVGGE